ncbi:uncharacterized protein LOC122530258 isoform X2 [Frieseomelitta varia]|uniref:uncharacterized protein LOC122530258 isoform X2 n=1 Tax=Frieseomelitta varia TaxID=561572 RepID=UPI001CB6A0FF|nr:uncharacterized protein LOC122530258 isoform X2 [Frieseomelitta varia]
MLKDRIKYAMGHLSHKQYVSLLAKPNWRRIQTRNVHILADPYGIRRSALRGRASKRIKAMARPKHVTKKHDPTQKIMAKLRRAIKPEQWDQHVELLEILAAPKVPPKPRFPRKRRWRPVNMRRIEELSTPVTREMPRARDPFKVARTALTYKISKRTQKIAYSKTMAEITPPRILGAVSPAALRAVASPRTVTLAKPVERPAGIETDLREDAFTVSPMALKAKCSKRLKFLARPKRRR